MPFESYLIENDRIVFVKLSDPLTPEEMEQSFMRKFIDDPRPYHLPALVDVTGLTYAPPAGAIRAWRKSALSHPNLGHTALFGATTLIRLMANTIFWLAHYDRVKFFDTHDHALAYLREVIARETDQ